MKSIFNFWRLTTANLINKFIILFFFTLVYSALVNIFNQKIFNLGGLTQLKQFLLASLQPELNPELLKITVNATIVTLAYAVCGTFLSILLGLIGGILTSQIWWLTICPRWQYRPIIWLTIRALLAIPRAIHEMLWGLFLVNIWGLDPLVAIVAIAIPFGAIVSKIFSEILDETSRQSLRALINSGVAPLTAFIYSLIPEAFLDLVSYSFYRFECSLRSAAVLGIIGAGGLGYQIFISLQSLRYQELWTFFYALIILNSLVDLSSAFLRRRLGCVSRLDLNLKKSARQKQINTIPASQIITIFFAILALVSFCFWYIHPDFSKLWSINTALKFPDNFFDFDLHNLEWHNLFNLSLQTLSMSLIAITIAGIGGILLSFPSAHNFFLPGGIFNPNKHHTFIPIISFSLSRLILLFSRAIPAPIWALVTLFILFPGILPGAIALGLHNLGILGRLMAEVIENMEKPPLQALQAQGTPPASVFIYGVLPLTMPRFFSYTLYRWEVCMRETVIVGLVGAGGLGRLLTEQLSSFDYGGVLVTLSMFVLLTSIVDCLSATFRS